MLEESPKLSIDKPNWLKWRGLMEIKLSNLYGDLGLATVSGIPPDYMVEYLAASVATNAPGQSVSSNTRNSNLLQSNFQSVVPDKVKEILVGTYLCNRTKCFGEILANCSNNSIIRIQSDASYPSLKGSDTIDLWKLLENLHSLTNRTLLRCINSAIECKNLANISMGDNENIFNYNLRYDGQFQKLTLLGEDYTSDACKRNLAMDYIKSLKREAARNLLMDCTRDPNKIPADLAKAKELALAYFQAEVMIGSSNAATNTSESAHYAKSTGPGDNQGSTSRTGNKQKWCIVHQCNTHDTTECLEVLKLKDAKSVDSAGHRKPDRRRKRNGKKGEKSLPMLILPPPVRFLQ